MWRIVRPVARCCERLGLALKKRVDPDRWLSRALVDALLFPNDVAVIHARHRKFHGAAPRLLRPGTLNEFLQHQKLFHRSAQRTKLADKLAVRDYVKERVGTRYLSRIHWVGTDLRTVDREALPSQFVVKSNHAYKTYFVVHDKRTVDWAELCETAHQWLTIDHSLENREWQYRWIRPQLYIEEYLAQPGEISPVDYKFYCFHGVPRMAVVIRDRMVGKRRDFVGCDCAPLDFVWGENTPSGRLSRPDGWSEMMALAGRLAAGLPFARVDLYALPRIVFGEITLCPSGGNARFDPPEKDRDIFETYLASKTPPRSSIPKATAA